ncbi:hypothetical protein [Paenibacillus lemnae]|uniref:Uncharacterized protein n=1 Tax=Paenibacillus lemnae TaxID=1330551 RepID=A0A848MBB0_PAELE|nr:hypothetical protein [Paenibacillus lemnae]NMO97796.1 hypothetical protein [Paenibacillus lemnae]
MGKALWTAVGVGAAYLLRNKDARQKLMNQVQDLKGKYLSNNTSSQSTTSTPNLTSNTTGNQLASSSSSTTRSPLLP